MLKPSLPRTSETGLYFEMGTFIEVIGVKMRSLGWALIE